MRGLWLFFRWNVSIDRGHPGEVWLSMERKSGGGWWVTGSFFPLCLCLPLPPPSQRPATILPFMGLELKMCTGWGLPPLKKQNTHTHAHTHSISHLHTCLHPWLPPHSTPSFYSAMPQLPLYPAPPTCSRWIIDAALRIKTSVYICICVFFFFNGYLLVHRELKGKHSDVCEQCCI